MLFLLQRYRYGFNFNKNEDQNKLLLSDLRNASKVKLGGGSSKIEKQHAKGKMTARERIDYLLDPKSESIEIGAFAGKDMYSNHGGCPSGGVVVKIGYIAKKQCIVVANDATVKAGAWFPITAKKIYEHKKLLQKTNYPSYIWWILQEHICRCKTKFSPIKNILVEFLETMPL